ncbi:hypothetical protein Drorol1_Dr00015498 [Drosera rotundifolia]
MRGSKSDLGPRFERWGFFVEEKEGKRGENTEEADQGRAVSSGAFYRTVPRCALCRAVQLGTEVKESSEQRAGPGGGELGEEGEATTSAATDAEAMVREMEESDRIMGMRLVSPLRPYLQDIVDRKMASKSPGADGPGHEEENRAMGVPDSAGVEESSHEEGRVAIPTNREIKDVSDTDF